MAPTSFHDPQVGSELEKYIMGHEALKPGDKLEGKVIQVKPGGKILMDFGKFRAVAESAFSIREGEIIHVRVVSKRPKLKLRLETSQLMISPGTRTLIGKLEMVPEDRWSHIRATLAKLLEIEGESLFPPGINDALAESEKTARLKILSTSPLRLSLLLDTLRFQQVRTDFYYLKEGELNLTFFVKNEEAKAMFEAHLAEIRTNLAHRFYHLVLQVIVSERTIARFDTEGLDAGLVGEKMLDVNV